jgi:hypothetical protein
LGRTSLTEGNMPTENPAAPPSGETPLSGASIPARAATSPSPFPFGLDSAAQVYASSVSTCMSAYEELPGHHLRSTLDLVASTPASNYRDSTETPKIEPHVTASQHRNPSDDLQRPHIPPSYYYFGAPDSDSADDTYDPTRECFNIDVESTSESEDEEPVEGRYTPPHVELPAERDDP